MKDLKKRLRKALFAFFREEILDAVINKEENAMFQPFTNITSNRMDVHFGEIKIDVDISDHDEYHRYHLHPLGNLNVEFQIEAARQKLFDEFLKYTTVDSTALFDRDLPLKKRLRISVLVGKLKHQKPNSI